MKDTNSDFNATGTVTVKDRREFTMDGVKNILSFDDSVITLETTLGDVNIEGVGLKIETLKEDGRISIKGQIDAFFFSGIKQKRGLFSGVFG